MKKLHCKLMFTLAVTAFVSLAAKAQDVPQAMLEDPKYGSTPEERKEMVYEINYFTDDYNNKNYDRAAERLQKILKTAPAASKNVYIRGINIYRMRAAQATSLETRKTLVDSLMMLYDLRIQYFGDDPKQGKEYLAGMKARDYMANNPSDKEGIRKLFLEAIELGGSNPDLDLLNIYFNALVEEYKADELETDVLLNEYDRLSKIFDASASADKAEAKNTFDALFISSGAANCENLVKVYKAKLEAEPDNAELIAKAFNLLAANECTDPFIIEVGEAYYKAEPSSAVALTLATAFENQQNFEKAAEYLNAAIETETDPATKASLALRIAGTELHRGNAKSAATYAKQAIEADPNNGLAYYTLAAAYLEGSKGCSDFNQQSVSWLAADLLIKAKDLVADDASMSERVGTLLSRCTASFPSNEECFFRGLDNGSSYTVSCGWVSGTTRVRTVK